MTSDLKVTKFGPLLSFFLATPWEEEISPKDENVGKAKILLQYGKIRKAEKRRRGGSSRDLNKIRKWEKTEMMERWRRLGKRRKVLEGCESG